MGWGFVYYCPLSVYKMVIFFHLQVPQTRNTKPQQTLHSLKIIDKSFCFGFIIIVRRKRIGRMMQQDESLMSWEEAKLLIAEEKIVELRRTSSQLDVYKK